MVAIKALSALALVGSVIAVPVAQPADGAAIVAREPQRGSWRGYRYNYNWSWGNRGGDKTEQPATETEVVTEVVNTPAAPETPAATAPETAETPAASTPSTSTGSEDGYMGIVNKWRSTIGKPALTQDSKLQANALDTSSSSGGALKHKLNPGSMGQVMAPGNEGNFESVFVGGWLCEIPSLPGLSSVCPSMTQGWRHDGQTGHAEILSSTSYTKIGCGLASGIWTCDVA